MCKVSDKLKLCTCKTKNIEQLKHYWILYKYQKSNIILVGEPILPQEYEIGKETNEYNYNKLEDLLNGENCFDIDIEINNKDILILKFTCSQTPDKTKQIDLVYEFVYKNYKWTANEYDPFDTNRLEKYKGKVVTSLNKNNNE
ncbi:MAG: hypothetical protein JST21_00010 [Bacteroidetes bacterium]|nr:hypothetical protein [Bacteroidota bacterium]